MHVFLFFFCFYYYYLFFGLFFSAIFWKLSNSSLLPLFIYLVSLNNLDNENNGRILQAQLAQNRHNTFASFSALAADSPFPNFPSPNSITFPFFFSYHFPFSIATLFRSIYTYFVFFFHPSNFSPFTIPQDFCQNQLWKFGGVFIGSQHK